MTVVDHPVQPEVRAAGSDEVELDRILAGGLLHSAYQPIVDLETGGVAGYEALARGPEGSPLERPERLFAAAHRAGRTAELEWACRAAAVRGALEGGLRRPLSLFINVEPTMLATPIPADARAAFDRARSQMGIVFELTERALTDRPAELLARVEDLRALDCAIALDDVGADRRSLALMPFIAPEVIKLDLRLVQAHPNGEIAAIVHAVNAEAERSGALLLAEGIETAEHLEIARALGARYGQGWFFGRPGALPAAHARLAAPSSRLAIPRDPQPTGGPTPFEIVSSRQPVRRGPKRLLLAISKHLEHQTVAQGEAAVLLATFQDARHFTPATAARYRELGAAAAFTGALGVGLTDEPTPGVRGGNLTETETLQGEWDVVVVGPHFAAAFTGRDLGDTGCEDLDRRFDFCLTYDRALALRAARALMARVAPA